MITQYTHAHTRMYVHTHTDTHTHTHTQHTHANMYMYTHKLLTKTHYNHLQWCTEMIHKAKDHLRNQCP